MNAAAGKTDIETLRARASSGDSQAQTALGQRMLVGDGVRPDPAQAVTLLRSAMSRGDAQAALQLSVCNAWGVGGTRNVEAALDCLQSAAGLGSQAAQRELRVLARGSGDDWPALRRGVDVAALSRAPAMRIVADRPRIALIERFMTGDECDLLIDRGRHSLRRAMVYRGSGNLQTADSRTNSEAGFTIFTANVALNLIRERIAGAAGIASTFFEITKLLHYRPGEQFGLHGDFLQLNTPELVQEVQMRGQRAATFLVYLNDDYDGGETDFPRIRIRHRGSRGDALLFANVDAAGAPDYDTVHAGLPTTRGEKWLLSQWIRTRPVGA